MKLLIRTKKQTSTQYSILISTEVEHQLKSSFTQISDLDNLQFVGLTRIYIKRVTLKEYSASRLVLNINLH